MNQENNKVIRGIRLGNNQVIKKLYDDYFHYATAFVGNNGGELDDRKEIFQEALIALYSAALNPDFVIKTKVKFYLAGIVHNLWVNELENRKKTAILKQIRKAEVSNTLDDDFQQILKEKIYLEEQYGKLDLALNSLGEDCKTLIDYTFFEKLKDKEISPLMNYSLEFVRQKRSRCLKKLKKIAREL